MEDERLWNCGESVPVCLQVAPIPRGGQLYQLGRELCESAIFSGGRQTEVDAQEGQSKTGSGI